MSSTVFLKALNFTILSHFWVHVDNSVRISLCYKVLANMQCNLCLAFDVQKALEKNLDYRLFSLMSRYLHKDGIGFFFLNFGKILLIVGDVCNNEDVRCGSSIGTVFHDYGH